MTSSAPSPPQQNAPSPPKRSDFRFVESLRVRWAEVDLQKIVFNGHYLTYFDTAVAGYWRALALPYHETMEGLGGDLYVRKATVEYLASARYDENLGVGVRATRVGRSSMTLQCAVFRGHRVLVHGDLVYVFADPATQTSQPLPSVLRDVVERFEASLPVLAVTHHRAGDAARQATADALKRLSAADQEAWAACPMGDAPDTLVLSNAMGVPVAIAAFTWASMDASSIEEPATPKRHQALEELVMRTVHVHALAVDPALRQSGLVESLVDALHQHVDSQRVLNPGIGRDMAGASIPHSRLTIHASEPLASALQRCGFSAFESTPEMAASHGVLDAQALRMGGRWLEHRLMVRRNA